MDSRSGCGQLGSFQGRRVDKLSDEILAGYLNAGGSAEAEVARLVRSLHPAACWIRELWSGDTTPLDGERLALLHGDLAGFTEHALGVRTLLAEGGGWASLMA